MLQPDPAPTAAGDELRAASPTLIERARARLRRRGPALIGAAVVTLTAWPLTSPGIPSGIDGSWMAGLHMAVHDRLAFGSDVVFTYGPLGFVAAPRLYYTGTGLVAMAVDLAIAAALAYVLIRLLNRVLGIVASVLVAAVALMVLNPLLLEGAPLLPYACFVGAALWSFNRVLTPERPLSAATVVGATALASVLVLVKLDSGLASMAAIGYAVAYSAFVGGGAAHAAKRAALVAGTAIVALPVLWVVIGQPLGALPDWLRLSWDIAAGYDAAMGIEVASESWEYFAAALVLALFAGGLVTTFHGRARWGVLGFVAVVGFITFKQGFVRHDNHSLQFFVLFALLPLVLLRRWDLRQVLAVAAVPAVCVVAVANIDLVDTLSPGPRIEGIADVAQLVVSSSERAALTDENRADLRAAYDLPPEVADRIGEQTVTIQPSELAIAWAYPEIDWRQAPVLQGYSAYTAELDHTNARFLAEPGRPEFVLRETTAPDGRLPRFDPPETTLELLCHYRLVFARGEEEQLFEAARDRCGPTVPISGRSVELGEPVRVPQSSGDVLVVARFEGIGDSVLDRVRRLVYKSREFDIVINDTNSFRFFGHQGAPYVMGVPECLGGALDGHVVPPVESLEVNARTGGSGDSFDVEFFEIPYDC